MFETEVKERNSTKENLYVFDNSVDRWIPILFLILMGVLVLKLLTGGI